ncbi:hypothetical protein [Streptomonospora wellingtoniae]|uniref:Uncharacterized protein n=1 Tax=Streptomonospora wellingtoniae TaxID=3075544 RepID=A0ABU2L0L8_9ACTN|nr:hypothetical protein [Streptomonospora sp. DSM 45055]MDT0305099.1 hypothetical protein [Streptomonospora sp. DSM 45055]
MPDTALTPAPTTFRFHDWRRGADTQPRLSITSARLPRRCPYLVEEVAPRWWAITVRHNARCGDLFPAYVETFAHDYPCAWRLLVDAFGVDPIKEADGLAAAYRHYPAHERLPLHMIPIMEACGLLIPWPHGRRLHP